MTCLLGNQLVQGEVYEVQFHLPYQTESLSRLELYIKHFHGGK